MYVTIIDIAKALGLSKSTVSRALSGEKGNVSPETARLVIETAERMGYKRNELAVHLRKRKTMTIGILVPELVTSFYSTFIAHAQQILRPKGYRTIVALSNEDIFWEKSNFDLLSDSRVDGILISTCNDKANVEQYSAFIQRNIPLVFFDRTIKGLDCSSVRSNDYKAAFFLMEHLIYKGRKRIAHLAGPDHIRNSADRFQAYIDTLSKHGIAYDPSLVLKEGTDRAGGATEVTFLLEHGIPFDAVFCFNEMQAIGAEEVLLRKGFRIPEDIAVASMYGTEVSTLVHPAVTSVEKPVARMAEEAVRLILRQIDAPLSPAEEVIIPSEMVIRESS